MPVANEEPFRPCPFVDGGLEGHRNGELVGAPHFDGGTAPSQQPHKIEKLSFSQPVSITPLQQRRSSPQRTPPPAHARREEGNNISNRKSQWVTHDDPEDVDEDDDAQPQNSTLFDLPANGTILGRSLREGPMEFGQPESVHPQPQWSPDSYGHLAMQDEIPGLAGVTTSEYQRYSRGSTCLESYTTKCNIPPLTTSFEAVSPEGWRTFVHPEGTSYFYRDDPNELVPVLTEAWIYDQAILNRMQSYITQISAFMRRNSINFFRHESTPLISGTGGGPRSEHKYAQDLAPVVLVLKIHLTGQIGYYFVSHRHQSLFWLDHFDFSDTLREVRVNHTDRSAGLHMKSHYWYHNEFFPHLYELTDDDIEEIDGMLGAVDVLVATVNSTVNVDLETLKWTEGVLRRHERKVHYKRRKSVGERTTIFRVTSSLYKERFINLFGDPGARLNATQSPHYPGHRPLDPQAGVVVDEQPKLSWYQHIPPDQIVSRQRLVKFSEKTMKEWRNLTLYVTVLLWTSMLFLTTQGVGNAGSEGRFRTRAGYFSTLASVAMIALRLLLLRRHREAGFTTRNMSWAMKSLALMYGLPFSLLTWSLSSFFAAFAFVWFTSHDWVIMTVVSTCCLAFAAVLTWAALASYENGPRVVEEAEDVGRAVRSASRSMSVKTIGSLPPFNKNSVVQQDGAGSGGGPGLDCDLVTPSKERDVMTDSQVQEKRVETSLAMA